MIGLIAINMSGTGCWTGSVARPQYDRIDSYEDVARWELLAMCARQIAASRIGPSAMELPEP